MNFKNCFKYVVFFMVIFFFLVFVIIVIRLIYIFIVGNVLIIFFGNFFLGGVLGLVDGWKGGLVFKFDG